MTRVHGSYLLRVMESCVYSSFSGGLECNTPLFLIKNIWGGEGGEGKYLACRGHVTKPRIDFFRLFESDDRRFALLSPASATSISFKAAQVPVSSDNAALLLRSDQYFRRDFTF